MEALQDWVMNLEEMLWNGVDLYQSSITHMQQYLVGGIPTPLKKDESQLGLLFPIFGNIKKYSKPPTRYRIMCMLVTDFTNQTVLGSLPISHRKRLNYNHGNLLTKDVVC
jgi:hypothetical protein